MGFFNLGFDKIIEKGADIIDQAVEDKDLANKLRYELAQTLIGGLYKGKGASITKITLVCLYAVITCAGLICLFTNPAAMDAYKDYLIAISPLIGSLTGIYGTMRHLNKRAEVKYRNNNGVYEVGERRPQFRTHRIPPYTGGASR